MSASNKAMLETNPIPLGRIYGPTGCASLLARAWNMFRTHWRESLLVFAAPIGLFMVQGFLFSIPNILPTLQATSAFTAVGSVLALLAGVAVSLLGSYAAGLAACVISRYYASALILKQPLSLQLCLEHTRRIWLPLTGVLLFGLAVVAFCVTANLIVFSIGLLVAVLISLLYGLNNPLMSLGATVTLILWGSAILTLILGIVGFQMLMVGMPLVTIANPELCPQSKALGKETPVHPEPEVWPPAARAIANPYVLAPVSLPLGKVFGYALRLTFSNLSKALLFSLMLFIFGLALSLVLRLPMDLWMALEWNRIGFGDVGRGLQKLPPYVIAIAQTWYSLIPGLLMPFFIGAITLFWYDGKVVKEAYDLRLWLASLVYRHTAPGKP